jgi:hypothetical protein
MECSLPKPLPSSGACFLGNQGWKGCSFFYGFMIENETIATHELTLYGGTRKPPTHISKFLRGWMLDLDKRKQCFEESG